MKKLILVSMIFILAACAPGGAGGSDLERNRQTWEDAGVSHYRMELHLSCFCAFRDQMPLTVEVQDGEVVSITAADGSAISTDDPNYQFFVERGTVERLFAEIEKAMSSEEAGEVTVAYDATLGFPVEAAIDYIALAADDELYISVSGLEQLP